MPNIFRRPQRCDRRGGVWYGVHSTFHYQLNALVLWSLSFANSSLSVSRSPCHTRNSKAKSFKISHLQITISQQVSFTSVGTTHVFLRHVLVGAFHKLQLAKEKEKEKEQEQEQKQKQDVIY